MNDDWEKSAMELLEKAQNIFCPYCYHKQDLDTVYKIATMWGDGEDKSCFCEKCGKDFRVEEEVTRVFKSYKEGEKNERNS